MEALNRLLCLLTEISLLIYELLRYFIFLVALLAQYVKLNVMQLMSNIEVVVFPFFSL